MAAKHQAQSGHPEGVRSGRRQQPTWLPFLGLGSCRPCAWVPSLLAPLWPGSAWSPCTLGGQRHSQSWLRLGIFPIGHSCPGVPRRLQPHGKLGHPLMVPVPTAPGLGLSVSCRGGWDPTALTAGHGLALLIASPFCRGQSHQKMSMWP